MKAREEDITGLLYESDVKILKTKNLMNDVITLQQGDLVHLSDLFGNYSRQNNNIFSEGVELGKGNIGDEVLKKIIKHLNKTKIPFVLEINEETDWINRPNTKASIEYILRIDN